MSEQQMFVSGLKQPWALIRVQGNGQPGRRPPTSVAWLEYPVMNVMREITGYYGCELTPSRANRGGWIFSYKHQKVISADRVLHTFPILFSKTAVYGVNDHDAKHRYVFVPADAVDERKELA